MSGKIRWLGNAFVEFITSDGKIILFDPWTKTDGNQTCPFETSDIKKADLVLVSHDHFDHVGSAAAICKQTGAILGGQDETIKRIMKEEGISEEQVVNHGSGSIVGGGAELDWVKIVSTPAIHTSNTSVPSGTIVISSDGTTIYHAGDTSITAEMEIFARLYPLDVAILPIFGIATMDGVQASEAVRLMKPKQVMPIHFDFRSEPEKVLNEFLALCQSVNPLVKTLCPIPGIYFEV
ncbi:MAG: metal-dependent hydrolase [Anaerolineaceae bacterium]|nr:metal-dependent hydrolase [Anaerolineaceae bacterium]